MNFLYRSEQGLDPIFAPKTIAVVGASEKEGSVGRTIMHNLKPFGGTVIPINPKRDSCLGKKAYPTLKQAPQPIDLVVVVTPAAAVPDIIEEAASLAIPAAVIISAGFKEMGPPGLQLEEQIRSIATKGKMRIVGPNCLGVMNPWMQLNATFAAAMALPGHLAFLSQSGALCTAVLDWSLQEKVGFSAFVSMGSMLDVDFGALINYFGNDPKTKAILMYMESLGDPRSFLSAAREVALTKPIILIKAGRTSESAKAAQSHTGSLAGSDSIFSAALHRVGILRVDTIADLFSMAEVLGKQPRPKGKQLTIVTNAGGPGVIATDALIASGGKLAPLSEKAHEAYSAFLPPHWSRNNPVDILGDASAATYAKATSIALNDPASDGVLVVLTPQDMTDASATAKAVASLAHPNKPLLASWMGRHSVASGKQILADNGVPTFEYPDAACRAFAMMARYDDTLKALYEVPTLPKEGVQRPKLSFRPPAHGSLILDEVASKEVLKAYHIPVVPTFHVHDPQEAIARAKEIGFPVVLKLFSQTITHKTDVGGVKLNIQTAEQVATAYHEIETSVTKLAGKEHFQGVTVQPMIRRSSGYELILGMSVDPQLGPVILFGSGGQLVEVYKDSALAIPPLTTTLAYRLMEQTKIYEALKGVRGQAPIDIDALAQILFQFSRMVVENEWIEECDINPLLVSAEGMIALDARIIAIDPQHKRVPLAIRPYPQQYETQGSLPDGTKVAFRPLRPEDEPLLIQFHKDLSQETVRLRYLKVLHYEERIAHERLQRICFTDYDREIAIAAIGDGDEILGIIRLTKIAGAKEATFGMTIKDSYQRKGIGTRLMEMAIRIASQENIAEIKAHMLGENHGMQALCKQFGFELRQEGAYILARKKLSI
ncbi:MAG: hypothetical protein RL235_703 [Chlamydiota bacterium]